MFDSCAHLWRLFNAFRAGAISPAEFRHRHHLALAICYASAFPFEQALDAFRTDLVRLIRQWGHERKYHETITRFWLSVALHYIGARAGDRCLAQVATEFCDCFGDKTLIERHYSPAVLASSVARAQWIEPDLAPIG